MPQESLHRVVVTADENSNPFELSALACRLIERGESRFEVVARRTGLGTATNLRSLLRRRTGLSPTQYRLRFAAPAPGATR